MTKESKKHLKRTLFTASITSRCIPFIIAALLMSFVEYMLGNRVTTFTGTHSIIPGIPFGPIPAQSVSTENFTRLKHLSMLTLNLKIHQESQGANLDDGEPGCEPKEDLLSW